jgi:MFS family permease
MEHGHLDISHEPGGVCHGSSGYSVSILRRCLFSQSFRNLAILMCAPATPHILEEFHSDDQLKATLLVSIWELGEVFGPLLIGPLSEVYGRLPIYHAANVTFIVFSAIAAESRSINMLIGCRFVLGLSVASTVLNPSIVGDMFKTENRGSAMAIMGMTPFIAPVLGPIIGAIISEAKGWRWTFWLVTIVTAVFEVIFAFTYRESYKIIILQRKAKRPQKQTGHYVSRLRNSCNQDRVYNISKIKLLYQVPCRSLKLPFTSLAVLLVSISGAIGLSYMYVIITNMTNIFRQIYGFEEREVGLTYLGLGKVISSHFSFWRSHLSGILHFVHHLLTTPRLRNHLERHSHRSVPRLVLQEEKRSRPHPWARASPPSHDFR